jgi:hypothetical protein
MKPARLARIVALAAVGFVAAAARAQDTPAPSKPRLVVFPFDWREVKPHVTRRVSVPDPRRGFPPHDEARGFQARLDDTDAFEDELVAALSSRSEFSVVEPAAARAAFARIWPPEARRSWPSTAAVVSAALEVGATYALCVNVTGSIRDGCSYWVAPSKVADHDFSAELWFGLGVVPVQSASFWPRMFGVHARPWRVPAKEADFPTYEGPLEDPPVLPFVWPQGAREELLAQARKDFVRHALDMLFPVTIASYDATTGTATLDHGLDHDLEVGDTLYLRRVLKVDHDPDGRPREWFGPSIDLAVVEVRPKTALVRARSSDFLGPPPRDALTKSGGQIRLAHRDRP